MVLITTKVMCRAINRYTMNDSSYKPVPRDVFRRSPVNVCSQAYRVPFGALIQKLDFCVQDPMSVLLGEDANQEPVSCNVEKMPNLLIAGNPAEIIDCIDSILLSILCKASPNDVRMLLVDTRVNYLTRYKDIPHLIAPVICDPSQVVEALKWAQSEWERRKKLFEDRNVKDIYGYNDYLHCLSSAMKVGKSSGDGPASIPDVLGVLSSYLGVLIRQDLGLLARFHTFLLFLTVLTGSRLRASGSMVLMLTVQTTKASFSQV